MKDFLPLGSVVLLKESNKRLMIFGRKQTTAGNPKVFDYIGCLFPEGHISADRAYLFDHNQISRVYLVGFQDGEEILFREKFLSEGVE